MNEDAKLLREALTVVAAAGLLIVALAGAVAGTGAALNEFIAWLGARWPGPPSLAPGCVFFLLFLAGGLLLVPSHLNHARLDRRTAEVHPTRLGLLLAQALNKLLQFMPVPVRRFEDRAALTQFLAFILHAALLVLIAGGIHRKPLAWAEAGTLLLLPNAGLTGKVLAVLALVAAEIGLDIMALSGGQRPLGKALGMGQTPGSGSGFAGERTITWSAWCAGICAVLVDLPTFVVLAVIYRTSDLIFTLLLCQVAAKTAVLAVAEFASVFLDWRNDRWVRSLARRFEMGAAADRRLEAAQKLLHLGEQLPIWARPAKAALAAALKDPDERVRETASQALKHLR